MDESGFFARLNMGDDEEAATDEGDRRKVRATCLYWRTTRVRGPTCAEGSRHPTVSMTWMPHSSLHADSSFALVHVRRAPTNPVLHLRCVFPVPAPRPSTGSQAAGSPCMVMALLSPLLHHH
jgi:hypothetical protein